MPENFITKISAQALPAKILIPLIKAAFAQNAAFRIQANGTSMQPLICHGDIIVLSPASIFHVGDVVVCAYLDESKLVVHRIIKQKNEHYLLRGDDAPRADGWVNTAEILGLATSVIKNNNAVKIYHGKGIPFFYAVHLPTFLRKWFIRTFIKLWISFYGKC